MAADGGWIGGGGAAPFGGDDPRALRALAQLRALLIQLEDRLARPDPEPLHGPVAADLAATLDALGQSFAQAQDAAAGRLSELSGQLAALAARVEGQAAETERLAARLAAAEARAAIMAAPALSEPQEPAFIRALLLAASGAAALSVAAATAVVLTGQIAPPRTLPPQTADLHRLPLRPGLTATPPADETATPSAPARTLALLPPGAPRDDYAAVAHALERGEARALSRLVGLAEAGNPQAQLHVARLLEAGAPGIPRDLSAARAWTRRAADGGDRVAMHNLGLFLMNGDGGPRDAPEAARWFRGAAAAGVIDSQHNLGLMYQAGRGVEQNLREAYRWFSVAANAGDGLSREKAVELEGKLAPSERAVVAREVSAFKPGVAPPEPSILPAPTIVESQALLARAGYYIGPIDGASSPAFEAAAAAYLRDRQGGR